MSIRVLGNATALAVENNSASHAINPGIPSKTRSGIGGNGVPPHIERPTSE